MIIILYYFLQVDIREEIWTIDFSLDKDEILKCHDENMTKMKGFCRCSYGPKLVDFEIIKRVIILSKHNLIRQQP